MLRYVVVLSVLVLAGCKTLTVPFGGYPSYTPSADTPILTKHLHPDTRPHPFPYSAEEIGLSAGEFTEFVRQRMWGCDSGCDFKHEEDLGRRVKTPYSQQGFHATAINIAQVPKDWLPTVQRIAHEMRTEIGLPVVLSDTKGVKMTFENTTGRGNACAYSNRYIIIATQHGADFTEHCIWQEVGHHYGLASDTDHFGQITNFRDTNGTMRTFSPLDHASYWVTHDPRIPITPVGKQSEILATIYHIAVHDLKLRPSHG